VPIPRESEACRLGAVTPFCQGRISRCNRVKEATTVIITQRTNTKRPGGTGLGEVFPTDRSGLRAIGAWLLAGSLLWWAAAVFLIPADDFFVGETARDEAASIAAHDGLFRAFHVVAALGTVAGSIGIVMLGRWLRTWRSSRLVDVAVAFAGIGMVAWLIEVAVRLTVTVARAREITGGDRSPGDEPAIGNEALFYVAALTFLAPMLCGWVLARRRVPGRRSSLVVAVVATLATVAGVSILAPSVIYQFAVLPMAVGLLLASRKQGTIGPDPA
jgi:hypothetical protein